MSPDRSLTKLRDNPELQKRLLRYSAAASLALAAGLALPARTGRADPGITCPPFDPETVSGGTFFIDFDDAGKTDPEFGLVQRHFVAKGTGGATFDTINLVAPTGGGDAGQSVMGYPHPLYGSPVASALTASTVINVGKNFQAVGATYTVGAFLGYSSLLPWGPGQTDKYLGLKFELGGNTHYGWALLDVEKDSKSFTIKEYCYNTTPGQGIHTGDRGAPPEPVGGYVVPVNRLELLGPWLWGRRRLAWLASPPGGGGSSPGAANSSPTRSFNPFHHKP